MNAKLSGFGWFLVACAVTLVVVACFCLGEYPTPCLLLLVGVAARWLVVNAEKFAAWVRRV